MKQIIAIVLAFLIVSCADSAPAIVIAVLDAATDGAVADAQTLPGNTSANGSRLKVQPIVFTGEDGSRVDTGSVRVFDEQLIIECQRGYARDGSLRCIPNAPWVSFSTSYYADATCMQPIVPLPTTTPCGGFVRVPTQQFCEASSIINSQFTVYRVTPHLSPNVYQRTGSNTCVLISLPPGTLMRVTGEVTPDQMVSLADVP